MPNGVRPTLISGFEDIVEYIHQQDQRIMALSQHNKELNNILRDFAECQDKLKSVEAENKVLKLEDDTLEDTLASLNFFKEQCDELKEENTKLKRTILSLKSSVIDLREARDKYEHKLIVIKNEVEFVQLELDGRVWTMDDEFVLTPLKGSDSEDEDDEDEEEKCEECDKALEGDDKCGEGCPAYDKGWDETESLRGR